MRYEIKYTACDHCKAVLETSNNQVERSYLIVDNRDFCEERCARQFYSEQVARAVEREESRAAA